MTASIALLAKAPIPGHVKTRLTPPLEPDRAGRVARALLELTIACIVPAVPARWTLFLDGPTDARLLALAADHGLAVEPQAEGDLGARLAAAFRVLRSRGATRTLALGADSPTLDPARVNEAIAALEVDDLVLGPAEDGGYYLVGTREPHEEIFRGIPWGTSRVLEVTLERAREAALTTRLLPGWYDVDGIEDLRRVRREIAERFGAGAAGIEGGADSTGARDPATRAARELTDD